MSDNNDNAQCRFQDLHDDVIVLKSAVSGIRKDIGEIKRCLIIGNGQPPLTQRVTVLETKVGTISKYLYGTISAAITSVIGAGYSLFIR